MTARHWEDQAGCRDIGVEIFHPESRGAELAALRKAA